ncbi:integrase, catalytic region, zinc finger, CCHC-type containing protein [Tanacetum coccineum]
MLIFSKSLLSLWAEAVATACYTQNRSLIHPRYNKTPIELLRDRKPELKYLHVFGALCYPKNDSENLGILKPKADIRIFIGSKLQGLSTGHISSGLVQNQTASPLAKPPTKNDEYFQPPSAVSIIISVATLPPPDTVGASSSITIDQDAPSLSTSPNNDTTPTPIPSTNVEEPNAKEEVEFNSDTFTNLFAPLETSSAESSSRIVDTLNMHTFQQP